MQMDFARKVEADFNRLIQTITDPRKEAYTT